MRIRVLGAAAGGGFPQWNCNCAGCRRARAGDPAARARTQASLAVSADGVRWVLLNASPDLPAQLRAAPDLQPGRDDSARGSPVAAVVISGGDIDCIAGLLSLRESHPFTLYAQDFVHRIFAENQVFSVLNKDFVRFEALPWEGRVALRDAAGEALGLSAEIFGVPGKVPLYQEGEAAELVNDRAVIGLSVRDEAGGSLLFIPGCARVTDDILRRAAGTRIMFFDGTLWRDDEMIAAGLGVKTGARMGHVSVSGPGGSLAAFADVPGVRKIFIHINNTNPILCDDSAEAAAVRAAGWEIAHDGMELTL
jgi:pyrroloquinoline quinone biosynthesis protein B